MDYKTNEVRIYQVPDEAIKSIDKLRLAAATGNHIPNQSTFCRGLLLYAIKLKLSQLKKKRNHVIRKPRIESRKSKGTVETSKS